MILTFTGSKRECLEELEAVERSRNKRAKVRPGKRTIITKKLELSDTQSTFHHADIISLDSQEGSSTDENGTTSFVIITYCI
jgi:hypothetical protein